ncbi:MAG: BACON domain-containing protein [Alistipes sp.]|nr:BACON domain-containing protein [Alistipes sp.]
MKLVNIFKSALVVVLAMMVAVACTESNVPEQPNNPNNPENPENPNDPEDPNKPEEDKVLYLELVSEKLMNFPAEGGEGELEWNILEKQDDSRTSPVEPETSTEQEWIKINPTQCKSFTVEANEGEAREGKITITYREQVIDVVIKQAGAGEELPPEQEPEPEPIVETKLAAAMRIPSAELGLENNNFVLAFVDDQESLELGLLLVGAEGVEVLAAGTYNVENEGLVAEECMLMSYTEDDYNEYFYEDGEVVVAVDGENYDFTITLVTTEGEEQHFAYSGVVMDMVPEAEPVEPEAFTPVSVKAECSMIGNFFLQLYIDDARYHELDMYDEVAPNEDYLSAGKYTYAAETISSWSTFSTGNDQTCGFADAEITLAHNADNTTTITGFIKSEEGDYITINWTGAVEGFVYEKETGSTFTVEALSAKVEYDKEGQKDVLFMVDELVGHKVSFKGDALVPGKPLADGEYSSEAATIDLAYCVHGYGDVYGDMTSAKATVANNLDEGTTAFVVEWTYEGNTYQLSWSGAVAGVNYGGDVVAEPLEFAPVYVEMVKATNSDRYFYFYDKHENELVVNLWNGKVIMPYINYDGVKIDIDTNDYTFEYSDNGLGKEDGLYTYNVRLVTLDGRLIEFKGNIVTYYSNN